MWTLQLSFVPEMYDALLRGARSLILYCSRCCLGYYVESTEMQVHRYTLRFRVACGDPNRVFGPLGRCRSHPGQASQRVSTMYPNDDCNCNFCNLSKAGTRW